MAVEFFLTCPPAAPHSTESVCEVQYLKTAVELFAACLQQLDVARRVDGVAQLGVRPAGQVVLAALTRLPSERSATTTRAITVK